MLVKVIYDNLFMLQIYKRNNGMVKILIYSFGVLEIYRKW